MKILMLGWELPPHNSGGLGVACYQLCKALSKSESVSIDFVLPYSADHNISFMNVRAAIPQNVTSILKSGIAYDSYKYTYTDGHEETVDIYNQQQLYEHSVAQLVDSIQFDVIHAHDWLTFRAAIRAKEKKNVPLIIHLHSIERDRAGGQSGNPIVREIEYTAMLLADRIIAVSNHTKNAIVQEYGIPSEKVEVVHNSIDLDEVQHLDADNAYKSLVAMKNDGYRIVTNIGRLTVQKNLPNLLYAAKEVIKRVPKTLFLIVGSGEQYFELVELAAELGIGKNIIFTGFQRGKRWRDSFAIADLFVMPSVSEPFGLTPLEAIGYGTPSLISKQSGVSEVLRNCLKVDFWDVAEMANKIAGVLQNDALRDELQRNAYQEYSLLSWNKAARQLKDIYKQHIDSGYVHASR